MKKRLVASKKVVKSRLARKVESGKHPFRGAQSRTGSKDPKDLRGAKGLLLKAAGETDAQVDQ